MKIATIVARILLGLVFFVLGLDAFLHFLPQPSQLPTGLAGDFFMALYKSHYLYAIKAFEVCGGLLLLIGRYVPLGLTLIGPVIVNILFYGIFLDHSGLVIGIVVAVLALFLLARYRSAFAGLVRP